MSFWLMALNEKGIEGLFSEESRCWMGYSVVEMDLCGGLYERLVGLRWRGGGRWKWIDTELVVIACRFELCTSTCG